MTTLNEKQQKLRKIINRACPELLRLEEGCEVEWTGQGAAKGIYIGENRQNKHYIIFKGHLDAESYSQEQFDKNVKVIGKPPTLEHLLTAIGNTEESNYYLVDVDGKFSEYVNYNLASAFKYDLSKSPLDQSEQVIDSLLEILN